MDPVRAKAVHDALLQVNVPMGDSSWATYSKRYAIVDSGMVDQQRRRPKSAPMRVPQPLATSSSVQRGAWVVRIEPKPMPSLPKRDETFVKAKQPLVEPWVVRHERAVTKRRKLEAMRLKHCGEVAGRPEARRKRRALMELQRRLMTCVVLARLAVFLGNELESDRNAWKANEEARVTKQPSERRNSFRSSRDERRRLAFARAGNRIKRWFVDRTVVYKLDTNPLQRALLRRLVARIESSFLARRNARSVRLLVEFLYASRRSARVAVKRVSRATRKVQDAVRQWRVCRAARLLVLERLFVREERLRRDQLIEDRRDQELRALERTKSHPIFGIHAARLFDASNRLHKLLSLQGRSLVARRLRATAASSRRANNLPIDDDETTNFTQQGSLELNSVCAESAFVQCQPRDRRAFVEAVLRNQRRRYRLNLDEKRLQALAFRAGVDDVKRLFFGPHNARDAAKTQTRSKRRRRRLEDDLFVCLPPEYDIFEPFLLLTPPGGAIAEIRAHVHNYPVHGLRPSPCAVAGGHFHHQQHEYHPAQATTPRVIGESSLFFD